MVVQLRERITMCNSWEVYATDIEGFYFLDTKGK